MAFSYLCPKCQATLTAVPAQAGCAAVCTQCQAPLSVPKAPDEGAPPPVATLLPVAPSAAPAGQGFKGWYHQRGPAQILFKTVLALLVLWVGYKYGVGPLFYALRGEAVQVVVENPGDDMMEASFSYRMLSDRLPPRGRCEFNLPIGMPETHGLKLTNTKTGEVRKYRLALRPGQRVLYNPEGKISYFVVDDALAKTLSVPLLPELAEQLRSLVPLTAHEAQRAAMLKVGQQALIRELKDEYIPLADYRYFGLPQGDRVLDASKPRLVRTQADLTLANGGVRFEPKTMTFLDGWVALSEELVVPVAPDLSVTLKPGLRLSLPVLNSRTMVNFSLSEQPTPYLEETFKLSWSYVYRLGKDELPEWGWSARGPLADNPKVNLSLTRGSASDPVIKITGR